MPKFTVVYVKIKQEGAEDVSLEGPFILGEFNNSATAENAAKRFVNESRDEVLIKVYDPAVTGDQPVSVLATEHFKAVLRNMQLAQELNRRPIRKRKKRRLLPKDKIDENFTLE